MPPRGRPPKKPHRTISEERALRAESQRKRRSKSIKGKRSQNTVESPLEFIHYQPDSQPTINNGPLGDFTQSLMHALHEPSEDITQLLDDPYIALPSPPSISSNDSSDTEETQHRAFSTLPSSYISIPSSSDVEITGSYSRGTQPARTLGLPATQNRSCSKGGEPSVGAQKKPLSVSPRAQIVLSPESLEPMGSSVPRQHNPIWSTVRHDTVDSGALDASFDDKSLSSTRNPLILSDRYIVRATSTAPAKLGHQTAFQSTPLDDVIDIDDVDLNHHDHAIPVIEQDGGLTYIERAGDYLDHGRAGTPVGDESTTFGRETSLPLYPLDFPPPTEHVSGPIMAQGGLANGDSVNTKMLQAYLPQRSVRSPSTPLPRGVSGETLRALNVSATQTQHDPDIRPREPLPIQAQFDTTNDPGNQVNEQREPRRRVATLIGNLLVNPHGVVSRLRSRPRVHRRGARASRGDEPRNNHKTLRQILTQRPWPTNESEDAHSLNDWLNKVDQQPYILDSRTLKKGQQLFTTASERQGLFSGVDGRVSPQPPPRLDFTLRPPPVRSFQYRSSFDVDSYILFADSLAIAKGGLKVLTVQRPTPPLKSGMHLGLFPTVCRDQDDPTTVLSEKELPLSDIPHIALGRFAEQDDLEVIVLFPQAVRPKQEMAKLTNELYTKWMDEVFLPAIHEVLPSNLSRVFPSSHEDARSRATLHAQNTLGHSSTKIKLLSYHIKGKYLQRLWEHIERKIRLTREPRFRDCMLFVNAKGIKNSTAASTWSGMRRNFKRKILDHLKPYHKIDAWIDVGKEWIYPESEVGRSDSAFGQTALWYMEYHNAIVSKFRKLFPDAPKSGVLQVNYPQYFLQGVGSTTIEPSQKHPLRKYGFAYAQWYNTAKDLFAAGDEYIAENTAVADLGIDPAKMAIMKHVGHAVSADQDRLIRSYLHLKNHIHHLQSAQSKSFSLREEYRVRDDLFEDIHLVVEGLQNNDTLDDKDSSSSEVMVRSSDQSSHSPIHYGFVRLHTNHFIRWIKWNVNRFCIGIEHIFSQTPPQKIIPWEQSRSVSMFFLGISAILGQLPHSYSSRFWFHKLPTPRRSKTDPKPQQGLGMIHTMHKHGFPWFMNKLDWNSLTFRPHISAYMGFERANVQDRLRRHALRLSDVRDCSARIEGSLEWLQRFGHNALCRTLLFRYFHQLCAHQFRCEVLNKMLSSIKDEYHDKAKEGSIALSKRSLSRILKNGDEAIKIKSDTRDRIKTWLDWCDIVYLDDVPKFSVNAAYHLPFQSALQVVEDALGVDMKESWQEEYFEYLRATHWLLPYPQNNRLMGRDSDKASGDDRAWCMFSVYNRHILRATQARAQDRALPLPANWSEQYRGSWVDHAKSCLLGQPALDIDLLQTSPTLLYERLCRMADQDPGDDTDDDDDLPDLRDLLRPPTPRPRVEARERESRTNHTQTTTGGPSVSEARANSDDSDMLWSSNTAETTGESEEDDDVMDTD